MIGKSTLAVADSTFSDAVEFLQNALMTVHWQLGLLAMVRTPAIPPLALLFPVLAHSEYVRLQEREYLHVESLEPAL
jgi:hypothetical protein